MDFSPNLVQNYSFADYGFEYSDEDVEEEDIDIENQYYNSKGATQLSSCRSFGLAGEFNTKIHLRSD